MKRINIESVNSTNNFAKKILYNIKENTIIVANNQTKGYGTNNRKWYANKDSIICSFIIKNKKRIKPDYAYKIGTIVSNVINNLYKINTYVNKPNDIYFNKKKLGGILIETQYSLDKLDYVIIGIGLNINQTIFPIKIKKIATSLRIETGNKYNKEDIIRELIKEIDSEEEK